MEENQPQTGSSSSGVSPTSFEGRLEEQNRYLLEDITPQKILLSRIAAYGGVGAAIAFLLALFQVQQPSLIQKSAVACFGLSVPFLIFLASVYEAYVWFGERTYRHFVYIHNRKPFALFQLLSYGILALGFFLTLASFSISISIVVFVVSFILVAAYTKFLEILRAVIDRDK